jgi:GNAT superfamily N-acetyltransferase
MDAMDIQIRRASPGEAGVLSDLACRAKAHWGYPAEWLRQWSADLTITPEYVSAHSTFVAVNAGTPVGVCAIELRGGEASLEHVWIAPEFHGRGIGRSLVALALDTAAHAGAARVEVASDPFAEAFYVRLGARRVRDVPAPMPGAPGRALPVLEFVLDERRDRPE